MRRSLILAIAATALLGCEIEIGEHWSQCRGEELVKRDERIRACTALIDAGAARPEKLAVAHLHRAVMRHEKGDFDAAMRDYDQAIRLKPDYADAFNSRGVLYADKGDPERAVQDYDEAIRLKPEKRTLAWALFNRGLAYAQKGKHQRAIEDYDRALEAMVFTRALLERGRAYFALGRYDRAIEDLDTTIRHAPRAAEAFAARAAAHMSKGDYARAIDDFGQSHRLAPADAYTVLYLHMARLRAGQSHADLRTTGAKLDQARWAVNCSNSTSARSARTT
jgi:tetratricopeptide (TPR) repeat protein